MQHSIPWLCFSLVAAACLLSSCATKPRGFFDPATIVAAPDYALADAWAALPFTDDQADLTPANLQDSQSVAAVDVFFLHPTTYTFERGNRAWNAPVDDPKLNRKTDDSTIKYQATIFNGMGRIYAPRYRQAHLQAYFEKRRMVSAEKALDLAYADIKAAFEYYLANYHEGRPIVIAAHSQGTTHAKRLLKEYFDGMPLQNKLVAAYLVGIAVEEDYFKFIKVCGSADETGCFCSWRTWRRGHTPKGYEPGNNIAVTNPLLWTSTEAYASHTLNKGAVLRNFEYIYPAITDAEVHQGLLWVSKPKFPWSFLLLRSNYHIGDFNFFYLNVRENAKRRSETFLNRFSSLE